MNPRLTMPRHGRAIAVVGALVAVSATTTMALVAGTAAAAPTATQPGKCIDNVNVRAEPSTTSKIVAVCESGKAVQVDETRDGFVHLADLKGWAAQEYVSVNGKTPPTPASRATPTTTTKPAPAAAPRRTVPSTSGNDVGPTRTGTAGDQTTAPDASGGTDQGVTPDQSVTPDQGGTPGQGYGQAPGDQGAAPAPAPAPAGVGGLFG